MHLKKSSSLFLVLILYLFYGTRAFSNIPYQPESQEIRVHLSTEDLLKPLYLGKLQAEGNAFTPIYLEELNAIFEYDFSYNGSTKLLLRTVEKEALLLQKDKSICFNPKTWQNWGASFVIKGVIKEKQLCVFVFSTTNGSLKFFEEIALSGSLNQDRRQLHKTHDAIHKALFDSDGIANARILYSFQMKRAAADTTSWHSEIWECDWDGANPRQVTKEGSYCVTPVMIPTQVKNPNDRFLYVSYKLGQPKIFIASLKEGVGRKFIDLKGNQLLPAVAPSRDKIAFISDAGGRTDLFLQPLNPVTGEAGKPIQLYSYPRSTQASPTFSPDGSKIAFVSDKDGSPRIYTIPANPSAKRAEAVLITRKNSESSCPAWSPDGRKLAYSAKTNGIRQIWIYDFALKEEKQLTSGPGNKENPAWAPDSLHIVFNTTDASSTELHIVNLNQPEAIKITKNSGKKHYPTWGTR